MANISALIVRWAGMGEKLAELKGLRDGMVPPRILDFPTIQGWREARAKYQAESDALHNEVIALIRDRGEVRSKILRKSHLNKVCVCKELGKEKGTCWHCSLNG